jgi:hypothetical protein
MWHAALLTCGAIGLFVTVSVMVIAAKLNLNTGETLKDGLIWGLAVSIPVALAICAAVAAVAAVVFGSIATVRAERQGQKPHWSSQLAGIGGTLSFGGVLGICMALYVLWYKIDPKGVKHTTEMQPMAYVMMGVMLGILVFGLGWCFYRAIRAAGEKKPDEQKPERFENS